MTKPGFFIIGAQKAGTTSLAALLDAVPAISLSRPKEPMLFCFDDFSVHRNEFLHPEARWSQHCWDREEDRAKLLEAYANCFAHAPPGDLLGEASTTYAPSPRAAERIAEYAPEARIIMVLRNPIDRAYSAYWHSLRKGLATRSFEHEIRFGGVPLLEFGRYREQLNRYVDLFGRENVHVVHFENLIRDESETLRGLLDYLNVPAPAEWPQVPRLNESFYPRSRLAHGLLISVMRRLHDPAPHSVLNFPAESEGATTGDSSEGGLRGIYRRIGMTERAPAPMRESTRRALAEYFRRENAGLSELLGEDVTARWEGV